jgi:cell division protein ZapA
LSEQPISRVSVRILEKEYQFSCPVDERAALLDAAEHLSQEMRKIRDTGKVVGLDRIAVMAALNMANDLLRARSKDSHGDGDLSGRVKALRERVESALERSQQLDL